MKKVLILAVTFVACTAFNASAGSITAGQTASCNDAKSITLEVAQFILSKIKIRMDTPLTIVEAQM